MGVRRQRPGLLGIGAQSVSGGTIPVAEVFESIQGEGFWSGTPAYFVRLAGCNLECWFCDTCRDRGKRTRISRIVEEARKSGLWRVVVTGGEPTIHPELPELVNGLAGEDMDVHLETNGTGPIPEGVYWLTVSPKSKNILVRMADELKVLWLYRDFLDYWDGSGFLTEHRFVQPVAWPDGKAYDTEGILAWLRRHQRWRLSLQLQKILKIR